jgi:hypothetical protein
MDGLAFRFVDGSADCSVDGMGLCCAGCKWSTRKDIEK